MTPKLNPSDVKHFLSISLILVLVSCAPKPEKQTATSSPGPVEDTIEIEPVTTYDEDDLETEEEEQSEPLFGRIIEYRGAEEDEVKATLSTFLPFARVHELAARSVAVKDSLETARGTQDLTDPEDTLAFRPVENAAYQSILDYKKQMASDKPPAGNIPSLIELTRNTEPSDSSLHYLPPARPSGFLSHGKFFFLGGAPFIGKLSPPDNDHFFTDPDGKPEVRFRTTVTENANYLLTSVYHFQNGPIDIGYGPPLDSYDYGPQEVRGIGSLIHRFVNRIPAIFITEQGIVPAQLISVDLKLVPEGLGCVSDQPYITFACLKNVAAADILGVYIPYHPVPLTSSTVSRPLENVWTADINNDGIADLACVSGKFEGASDLIAQCLWFANINGTWKIIDFGEELDCT